MGYDFDDLHRFVAENDQMARDAGHDLDQDQDQDQDQVQAELHAYLVARGRPLARAYPELDQATDDDLARIGRADCLDQHPHLDPTLAMHLEMIANNLKHNPHPSWDKWATLHRGHRHAANETCSDPGPGPSPDPSSSPRPDIPGNGDSSGLDHGQGDHQRRAHRKTKQTKHRNPLRDYPDEEWE